MKTILSSLLLVLSFGVFGQTGTLAEREDMALKEYFAANNIKPQKLASGVYIVFQKPGSGPHIHKRQGITIVYTGKLLDGTVFDSNVGKSGMKVHCGQGEIIKGMDIALLEMKYGSKATIYIPSGLGYGSRVIPDIPANSILIFELDVIDVL